MNDEIKDYAEMAKLHLKTHKGSIVDVKCIRDELDSYKQVFFEILGESFYKRVTFLPQ